MKNVQFSTFHKLALGFKMWSSFNVLWDWSRQVCFLKISEFSSEQLSATTPVPVILGPKCGLLRLFLGTGGFLLGFYSIRTVILWSWFVNLVCHKLDCSAVYQKIPRTKYEMVCSLLFVFLSSWVIRELCLSSIGLFRKFRE